MKWRVVYYFEHLICEFTIGSCKQAVYICIGVNPQSARGSRTGVFIGASASEAHEAWSTDPEKTVGYCMTGCQRAMFANRLSFFFDFKGQLLIFWSLEFLPFQSHVIFVKKKSDWLQFFIFTVHVIHSSANKLYFVCTLWKSRKDVVNSLCNLIKPIKVQENLPVYFGTWLSFIQGCQLSTNDVS